MNPRALPGLIGLLLFALGTLLMWRADTRGAIVLQTRVDESNFPRQTTSKEAEREDRRRTLVLPLSTAPDAGPWQRRDPLLAAIPATARSAIVFEGAAVRDSPVGKLMLSCGTAQLHELDALLGVDRVNHLDRIAVTDDIVIAVGDLDALGLAAVRSEKTSRFCGGVAHIYELDSRDSGSPGAVGTCGKTLTIFAKTEAAVAAAVERLEGGADSEPRLLRESDAYGDVYGVLTGEQMARLLPETLAPQSRAALGRVEIHVDLRDDVFLVADASGSDLARVEELGGAVGTALALARLDERRKGPSEFSELLETFRVLPYHGGFRVEAALPLATIKRALGDCAGGAAERR